MTTKETMLRILAEGHWISAHDLAQRSGGSTVWARVVTSDLRSRGVLEERDALNSRKIPVKEFRLRGPAEGRTVVDSMCDVILHPELRFCAFSYSACGREAL